MTAAACIQVAAFLPPDEALLLANFRALPPHLRLMAASVVAALNHGRDMEGKHFDAVSDAYDAAEKARGAQ